jgi:hypothetical protein
MKRIWMIFVLANAARGADVTLSMTGEELVPNGVLCLALHDATKMFAGIGIRLEWKNQRPETHADGVRISVKFVNGIQGHPDAMGFANPFDPVPVVTVMYDHILFATEHQPNARATLLAHTLVHEIGHILMRSNAHSPDGVMKAHWSTYDYSTMAHRPLAFFYSDADTIRDRLGLIPAAGAWASDGAPTSKRVVTACLNPGANGSMMYRGQAITAQILKEAGIRLDWQSGERACAGGRGVVVSVSRETPVDQHPGALAYAQPFEGTHVVLFYDRVLTATSPAVTPYLLGHVLAHEIVHLLQVVEQHSASGLMKARWDNRDYVDMQRTHLKLTKGDLDLIDRGLKLRASKTVPSLVENQYSRQ